MAVASFTVLLIGFILGGSSFEQLKKYLEENADEWIEW